MGCNSNKKYLEGEIIEIILKNSRRYIKEIKLIKLYTRVINCLIVVCHFMAIVPFKIYIGIGITIWIRPTLWGRKMMSQRLRA